MVEFCTDLRFEEDTLFIIFEEDYRFTPDPGDSAWTVKGRKDMSSHIMSTLFPSPPPGAEAASSSSDAASSSYNKIPKEKKEQPTAYFNPSGRKERASAEDYKVYSKAPAADWKNPSRFLRDLVAYATIAHRKKRGDFIFCGWQPHGCGEAASCKNKDNFRSGLMLTMVSKQGFWELETQWKVNDALKTPGHVDLCFKKFFSNQKITWSSYISPPLGGYTSHLSGCEKAYFEKPRESIWCEDFACPGTRKSDDWNVPPRQKWLCSFTANGKANYLCKMNVDVADEKVWWLTSDERVDLGAAKETGGWGCVQWDPVTKEMSERTERELRAGRQLRMKHKFRHFVNPTEGHVKAFPHGASNHSVTVCTKNTSVKTYVGTRSARRAQGAVQMIVHPSWFIPSVLTTSETSA